MAETTDALFDPAREVSPYSYKALLPGEFFRLLELDRSTNSVGFISCFMDSFSADNMPAYRALSYTWGDSAYRYPILLNGCRFLVTHNLLKALERMLVDEDVAHVWIDAICVNQRDLVERSQQVSYMRQIYQNAQEVLIFLGIESTPSEEIASLLEETKQKYPIDDLITEVSPPLKEFASIDMRRLSQVLGNMFSSSWFTRVWVVQEFASARSSRMYYGLQSVSTDLVEDCVKIFRALADDKLLHLGLGTNSARSVPRLIDKAYQLFQVRQEITRSSVRKFSDLLARTAHCEASDPRDKVFALLGMRTDETQISIMSDYETSVVEVYKAMFRKLLEAEKDLSLLYRLRAWDNSQVRINGLPTWVPDFGKSDPIDSIANRWEHAGNCRNWTMQNNFGFSKDGMKLIVSAIDLDQITYVECTPPRSLSYEDLEVVYRRWKELTGIYLHDRSALVLECLLLGPRKHKSGSMAPCRNSPRTGTHELETYFDEILNTRPFVFAKAFMITQQGYIGVAPCAAQQGDRVCELRGARVLILLRPIGNGNYTFVGEWYVA
ncbi:MAG: hypothetical protein Q9160_003564 [Pyrenula sp. 1 TL-2023]